MENQIRYIIESCESLGMKMVNVEGGIYGYYSCCDEIIDEEQGNHIIYSIITFSGKNRCNYEIYKTDKAAPNEQVYIYYDY